MLKLLGTLIGAVLGLLFLLGKALCDLIWFLIKLPFVAIGELILRGTETAVKNKKKKVKKDNTLYTIRVIDKNGVEMDVKGLFTKEKAKAFALVNEETYAEIIMDKYVPEVQA